MTDPNSAPVSDPDTPPQSDAELIASLQATVAALHGALGDLWIFHYGNPEERAEVEGLFAADARGVEEALREHAQAVLRGEETSLGHVRLASDEAWQLIVALVRLQGGRVKVPRQAIADVDLETANFLIHRHDAHLELQVGTGL